MQARGQVRVGRCKYEGGERVDPVYPGFTTIIVLTKSASRFGMIGPYELRDEAGHIMENIWQFSKVYREVPEVAIKYAARSPVIAWRWPAEVHTDEAGVPNERYWLWREIGQRHNIAVRYPVGQGHMRDCLYALEHRDGPRLGYIEARKRIYGPVYVNLVRQHALFRELRARLDAGENLLIAEVDGPHQESLDFYKNTYGVANDFIDRDTMLATPENIRLMLNDPRHPFGHGYCLAAALLDIPLE